MTTTESAGTESASTAGSGTAGSGPTADRSTVVRLVRSPWLWFVALVALAWVVLMALHIRSGHHAEHASLGTVVAMWLVMVLAMMAPTAVPVLASLRDIVRNESMTTWWWFLGAYLVVWSIVAAVMATAQWWLSGAGLLDPAGASTSYWLTAALLVAAGGYQFSTLKHRCQTECERPMTFFWRHWRSGTGGAVRMGLRHGAVCVGCCWLLMLLAFVAGAANVWFMLLGAVVMAAEKVPAIGRRISVPLGAALLVAGALTAVAAVAAPADAPAHQHTHPTHLPHTRLLAAHDGEDIHGTLVDRG